MSSISTSELMHREQEEVLREKEYQKTKLSNVQVGEWLKSFFVGDEDDGGDNWGLNGRYDVPRGILVELGSSALVVAPPLTGTANVAVSGVATGYVFAFIVEFFCSDGYPPSTILILLSCPSFPGFAW